jgi:hypothetical protein
VTSFIRVNQLNQRNTRWRLALIIATLVVVQAVGAMFIFGAKNSYAWFGTGHCTMPGGFSSGHKCLAADTVNGVEKAQQPYKGEIILPAGTTSISDHMLFNGSNHVAGTYQLQLLEDEGGKLNVYQTINYTVDAAGTVTLVPPSSWTLNPDVHKKAFVEHPVGSGGMIGYFMFISNSSLPANAMCVNTVSFNNGALGSGNSGSALCLPTPPPVPSTGKLSGHIYDCTSGVADTSADVTGGFITVTSGPETKPKAGNPVVYPVVPSGDYVESALPPPGFHFTFSCGGASTGSASAATEAVHVPVGGEGVGTFNVVRDTGTITGHIYDCTGGTANLVSDITGGTIAVSGTLANKVPMANAILYVVPAGQYTETATAPVNYHLVPCNGSTGANTAVVSVPSNGVGTASFYVAHDTGQLAGHIWDCTAGATTSEVPGGTLAASGLLQNLSAAANPMNPTTVPTGAYVIAGTAPTGYHFVACNVPGGGSSVNVTVPKNGLGVGILYVAKNAGSDTGGGSTTVTTVTTGGTGAVQAAAKPAQAVLGAATTNPVTGRGAIVPTVILSLLLMTAGAVVLLFARNGRRREGAA